MKKASYILGMLAIIGGGLFAIYKIGYTPAPTEIMKPSYFAEPEEIGVELFRQLSANLKDHKLVVFGIPPQPEYYQNIIHGFLKTATDEKNPFDAVIVETNMPALDLASFPSVEVITTLTNTQTQADLVDHIQRLESQGKRTLIYAPSVYSTHLLRGNMIQRLEKTVGKPLTSISVGPIALRPAQEYVVDPPCVGGEVDKNGTSDFGCAILQAGRIYYRKELPQDRWTAVLNEQRANDYLLLVSRPGQDKDEVPPVKPPPQIR